MFILAVKYQISQMFFANLSDAGMRRRHRCHAKKGLETRTALAKKRKPLPQDKGFLSV
jgi:hypothetical protein